MKPDNPPFCVDIMIMDIATEAQRHRLITEHMFLVDPIASNFRGRKGIPFEDLLAAGREGLCQAARHFNAKLAKFETFAQYRIRGQILDFIESWQHLVPIGDAEDVERGFHEWDIWGSAAPYEKWTRVPATPEELILAYDELRRKHTDLMEAWKFLPRMERSIIWARYFRDPPQTLNSIAREYKMPYATTVDFINRTLKRLAERIGQKKAA